MTTIDSTTQTIVMISAYVLAQVILPIIYYKFLYKRKWFRS